MRRPLLILALAGLSVRADAQAPVLDHAAVGCVVADRNPRFEATISPADQVARAQVYFRSPLESRWYWVPMRREGARFAGVLPKPTKTVPAFEYYIEATTRSLGSARTPDHRAAVVGSAGDCSEGAVALFAAPSAAVLVGTSEAAASLVPAGFSGSGVSAAAAASGGIGTSTLAIAGGAVAAGAVAVVAAGGGDEATPTVVATPSPSPFQRFFGTYVVEYVYVAPSVNGCDGAGSFPSVLAGNADGSGFTFTRQPNSARDPGTISLDGRFRTVSDNTLWVTEGQTDGTTISGRRSSSICFSQFSGRRQ